MNEIFTLGTLKKSQYNSLLLFICSQNVWKSRSSGKGWSFDVRAQPYVVEHDQGWNGGPGHGENQRHCCGGLQRIEVLWSQIQKSGTSYWVLTLPNNRESNPNVFRSRDNLIFIRLVLKFRRHFNYFNSCLRQLRKHGDVFN